MASVPYSTVKEFNALHPGVNLDYIITGTKKDLDKSQDFFIIRVSFNKRGQPKEFVKGYPNDLPKVTLESLIVDDVITILDED